MLRAVACLQLSIWLDKPHEIPVYSSESRNGWLGRHIQTHTRVRVHTYVSFRTSPCILSALHTTVTDFTGCPEHSSTEYGNYSGREGIPASSRQKNNSRFMKHKLKSTTLLGFEQESTEASETVPAPICQNAGRCYEPAGLSIILSNHTHIFFS